jgi:chromosome segregation ATPase
MTLELDLGTLASAGLTVGGMLWGLGKLLLSQASRQIETQFDEVKKAIAQQTDESRRLEREVMELKVDLPRSYVRKEDYTQQMSTIMLKIDALGAKMEKAIYERRP